MSEVEATPAAEEAAAEHGVDLGEVEGSGVEGRVLKSDVEEAAEAGAATGAATGEGDVEAVQERTQAAVENAGQPTPEDQVPGYGDEPRPDSPDIEGSDDARRVHPDIGGYQYQGDDSDAQFREHGDESQ